MKKRIVTLMLMLSVLTSSFLVPLVSKADKSDKKMFWPSGPKVTAESAIVMEANTGTILYEKKIHEKHFPASITKILTTLIALENCDLSETVTFSKDAIYKTEGTSIWRDVGEKMTLEETLYAVMLGSANECAYATAEHVGGDYDTFIEMMNKKAKEIGCVDSNFENPHGLPNEKHVVSAYDMALIARAAIKNDKFRTITGTKKYVIPPTNKHDEPTYLVNHHGMNNYYNGTGRYVYEHCIGGKTGYTRAAKNTLVTYAEKDGMLLICVVLKDESADAQYKDTRSLLDYCFENFHMFNVADCDTTYDFSKLSDSLEYTSTPSFYELKKDSKVILPMTADFKDATSKLSVDVNDKSLAGVIEYYYGERKVGQAEIQFTGVKLDQYKFKNQEEKKEEKGEEVVVVKMDYKKIILIIIVTLSLVGLIVFLIFLRKNIYVIRYNMMARKDRRRKELTFREKRRKREKSKR